MEAEEIGLKIVTNLGICEDKNQSINMFSCDGVLTASLVLRSQICLLFQFLMI